MKIHVTSRSDEPVLAALLDADGNMEVSDSTVGMLDGLFVFGRFEIIPPSAEQLLWTLNFQNDYD